MLVRLCRLKRVASAMLRPFGGRWSGEGGEGSRGGWQVGSGITFDDQCGVNSYRTVLKMQMQNIVPVRYPIVGKQSCTGTGFTF